MIAMRLRVAVVLRDTVIDDAGALVELWRACVDAAKEEVSDPFGQQSLWVEPTVAEAATAMERYVADPETKMIVALVDGAIVGCAVGVLRTSTPITSQKMLVMTDLQVLPTMRKRCVGSALLSGLATYAEEHGAEMVLATLPVHAKEPNRYLTKIGFNQIGVVRAIQTGKLRARLSGKTGGSKETARILAVRRTLRLRQRSGSK